MKKLKCYPFKFNLLYGPVLVAEGFDFYDGVLGDEPDTSHRGIDYARADENGNFITFEVFSVHDGNVFQGKSDSWGNFVKVYKWVKNFRFETVYAHLDKIPEEFPILPEKVEEVKGFVIREGSFLGRAGTSGDTKGNIQLHFELQIKNLETNQRLRLDPYGIYDRYTSGKYPRPGNSLGRCKHYWTKNKPPFADEL